MVRRASDAERQQAKKIADAALQGRTTMLEAVRGLCPFAHTDAIPNEQDRLLIIGIDSDTDSLPVGEVRRLWAPDSLEEKDRQIKRAEQQWKDKFLEACRRIAGPDSGTRDDLPVSDS